MSPATPKPRRTLARGTPPPATSARGRSQVSSPTTLSPHPRAALRGEMALLLSGIDMHELQQARIIEGRISSKALDEARQATGASVEEFRFAMAMSPATWKRRMARKGMLDLQEAESVVRIARIAGLAKSLVGPTYQRWLTEPLPILEGKTPLSTCRTEPGGRAVQDLLYAIDAGNVA